MYRNFIKEYTFKGEKEYSSGITGSVYFDYFGIHKKSLP